MTGVFRNAYASLPSLTLSGPNDNNSLATRYIATNHMLGKCVYMVMGHFFRSDFFLNDTSSKRLFFLTTLLRYLLSPTTLRPRPQAIQLSKARHLAQWHIFKAFQLQGPRLSREFTWPVSRVVVCARRPKNSIQLSIIQFKRIQFKNKKRIQFKKLKTYLVSE